MSQPCASCQDDLREDDEVAVLESGDVICLDCMSELSEEGWDEVAYQRHLRDVHPDWRA